MYRFSTLLLLIYGLIVSQVVILTFSGVEGYRLVILPLSLDAVNRVRVEDFSVVLQSVTISVVLAALFSWISIGLVGWLVFVRRQRLLMLAIVSGFFCSAALRASSVPVLGGSIFLALDLTVPHQMPIVYLLLVAGATVLPLSMAICLLSGGDKLESYYSVYRNLGGGLSGALKEIAWPVLKKGGIAAFLFSLSMLCFDAYVIRVAGAQALPSIGSLLLDLRLVSDWPMISIISAISLALLLPFFLYFLPKLTRND